MKKLTEGNPKEIQSVARAIQIMNCFDSRRPILSLAEICNIVELNKSTVYGLLYTLLKYGYIAKDTTTGKYTLGRAFINNRLLMNAGQQSNFETISAKYLKQLITRYDVTSYLFSYEHDQLNCLEMLIPHHSLYGTVSTVLGRKMAYHAAASGKVVMAHFTHQELKRHIEKMPLYRFTNSTMIDQHSIYTDIRRTLENGYAREKDEVDENVSALSVPIYDSNGSLIGTLSVSGHTKWIDEICNDLSADLLLYSRAIMDKLADLYPNPSLDGE